MTFATLVNNIISLVDSAVIPVLYALAFVFFLIGLVRFLFIGSSEEDKEKGKNMMLYGGLGLVVLFIVWGLVNLGLSTLNSIAGGTTI